MGSWVSREGSFDLAHAAGTEGFRGFDTVSVWGRKGSRSGNIVTACLIAVVETGGGNGILGGLMHGLEVEGSTLLSWESRCIGDTLLMCTFPSLKGLGRPAVGIGVCEAAFLLPHRFRLGYNPHCWGEASSKGAAISTFDRNVMGSAALWNRLVR